MKKTALLILTLLTGAACNNKSKTGFIHLQQVFNNFEYKKELEKELTGIKNSRKYILDSLETELKIMRRQLKTHLKDKELFSTFQERRELYIEQKSRFEDEEALMVKQYDEKIITQLNSYVKEFGKKEKYDIIYGATATGNIMYGDTTLDLTQQVTEFINAKFKGKK